MCMVRASASSQSRVPFYYIRRRFVLPILPQRVAHKRRMQAQCCSMGNNIYIQTCFYKLNMLYTRTCVTMLVMNALRLSTGTLQRAVDPRPPCPYHSHTPTADSVAFH